MPSITIRDVSGDVRDELAARARLSGRSLQEFLRMELIELAGKPDQTRSSHVRGSALLEPGRGSPQSKSSPTSGEAWINEPTPEGPR